MKRLDILTSLQAVGYRWLVRDEGTQNISNSLTAYEQKPTRNELGCWSDLGYKFVEEDQCFPDVQGGVLLDINQEVWRLTELLPIRKHLTKVLVDNKAIYVTRDIDDNLVAWQQEPYKDEYEGEWVVDSDCLGHEVCEYIPHYLSDVFRDVQWCSHKPLLIFDEGRPLDKNKWINEVPINSRVYVSCFPDVTTAVKGHYAGFDALNPTEHFMTYKAGTSEWTSKDEKGRTHWKYCWLAEEVDESEL